MKIRKRLTAAVLSALFCVGAFPVQGGFAADEEETAGSAETSVLTDVPAEEAAAEPEFTDSSEAPDLFADPVYPLGDVNNDGFVDSSDASSILEEYSITSTGGKATFTKAEFIASDINTDGVVDSDDASQILNYYAYVQTGGKLGIKEYLENGSEPIVTTTAPKTTTTTVKTTTTAVGKSTTTAASKATTTKKAVTTTKKATTTKASAATTTKAAATTKAATTTKKAATTTKKATTTAKPTTVKTTTVTTTTVTTVPVILPESIKLNKREMALNVNEGDLAMATVLPLDADNTGVTWSSSDESIARVDSTGWVTGVGEGICVITARSAGDPTLTANMAVTVTDNTGVKGVRLTRTELTLERGTGGLLEATVLPSTAANKSIVWTSSDETVAVVDSDGWVIGISSGTCTIRAASKSDPEIFAEAVITVGGAATTTTTTSTTTTTTTTTTVTTTTTTTTTETTTTTTVTEPPLPTEIMLEVNELTMAIGERIQPRTAVIPADSEEKGINWTSSDESVATVDSEGDITAVGEGTCTITVRSAAVPEVSNQITVTVIDDPTRVKAIYLTDNELVIGLGGYGISWLVMAPETAENKAEIWTSSDSSIASVDRYGNIYGKSLGDCTVTVTSADNPGVSADILVHVVKDPDAFDPRAGINSSIEGISDSGGFLFRIPFPIRAMGHFTFKYIITDANGSTSTIVTDTFTPPIEREVITELDAETNNFSVSVYVYNEDAQYQARIGAYKFNKTTHTYSIDIEDIYYAFYICSGVKS